MNKIKVTYNIPQKTDDRIDRVIIKVMREIGGSCYAEGYNFQTKERDLIFEINHKNKNDK